VQDLTAEFLVILLHRIALGLGAAFVRPQALQNAGLAFATPSGYERRVQTFAPEQSADRAGLAGGGIEFSQDTLFVFAGEGSSPRVGSNFGIWSWWSG